MIRVFNRESKNGVPGTVYNETGFFHDSYHGQVVSKGEENGYHDSDFYAIVPDYKGGFKKVYYATTRGWSYGNSATIDAPPSLIAEYKKWNRRKECQALMKKESARYEKFKADCVYWLKLGIENNLFELWDSGKNWEYILNQLSRATRSTFRLSLRDQITQWLENPNGYKTPLSIKQQNAILRFM